MCCVIKLRSVRAVLTLGIGVSLLTIFSRDHDVASRGWTSAPGSRPVPIGRATFITSDDVLPMDRDTTTIDTRTKDAGKRTADVQLGTSIVHVRDHAPDSLFVICLPQIAGKDCVDNKNAKKKNVFC
jgi:hypothetical protein